MAISAYFFLRMLSRENIPHEMSYKHTQFIILYVTQILNRRTYTHTHEDGLEFRTSPGKYLFIGHLFVGGLGATGMCTEDSNFFLSFKGVINMY